MLPALVSRISLVRALLLAFAVAVAVGAPVGMTLGAVVAAWALAGYGLWWVGRHGASNAEAALRRK